ncbi:hypothetical protein A5780_10490 [Nocardia sp. 852002-20019_SCH5090214]|nr:hypothetical protein A5780_10490 [Nocardia sp. 852002-20019_SCH5090214]
MSEGLDLPLQAAWHTQRIEGETQRVRSFPTDNFYARPDVGEQYEHRFVRGPEGTVVGSAEDIG